eukprot:CAMPEP_0114588374 /NCGR_PEP_ID=MMETSP0125-20121206/11088_1 /TAXON_ID=485358 ORGANISM="Aristerostoma sp., Strain ATCC 50986" /NCGR_SAMPLE_ID=MMETSP0125 /ASSEMBLY_ACC=CAM_ASM_000245 /LENGTH=50 /DNA_ID=CAMNT_0001784729 /DNA_START=474 /DNA_END=626 /DNA_ORIENTATION=+
MEFAEVSAKDGEGVSDAFVVLLGDILEKVSAKTPTDDGSGKEYAKLVKNE